MVDGTKPPLKSGGSTHGSYWGILAFWVLLLNTMYRVPKELISRFVKLCPTCQVRRGTSRNTPPHSEKGTEPCTDTNCSDETSGAYPRALSTSRTTTNRHPHLSPSQHLQATNFKAVSAVFEQQSRWMTPIQAQQSENHLTPHSPSSHIGSQCSHESYNTMPPMPMNCTNATPPGPPFPSAHPFTSASSGSQAFETSPLTQPVHGHVSTTQDCRFKVEHSYI